jgi:hypothetical protein
MTLSKKHVKDVCLHNCGSKTCRYLSTDELDSSKFYCFKLRPIDKNDIDQSIEDFSSDCKRRKINPKSIGKAIGDNCEGFLLLKNLSQGYDVIN